jgi:nitrate reductase NapE component
MSSSSKKTWVSILIAAVIIIGMMALAVVGGTAFFIYRHINAQFTPPANAEREFEEARARFAGQRPLIEMRNDAPVLHRDESKPRRELQALHALAYDPDAEKLVHIDIPMWLLRLVPSRKTIHISDLDELNDERANLTLEDLERHGPGLVLDIRRQHQGQVLVWTE